MPGLAKCRQCGDEIHWFQTPNGRTHPPVVPGAGKVSIVIDGVIYSGRPWNDHVCDPLRATAHIENELKKAAALEEHARIRREAQEEREARRQRYQDNAETFEQIAVAREAFARATYAMAMKASCPKCSAKAGEPCENLTQRRAGRTQYTKRAHFEREMLFPLDLHPFWISDTQFVIPDPTQGET